jgi:hypothetical protein
MGQESQYPGLIRLGETGNLYIQVGTSSFSGIYTDTTDMPLRTQLTHVDFAAAVVYDTYSPATDATMTEYILFVDVAVSSGAINVYRSSQGAVSGLPYKYCLIGRVETTD